MKQNIFKKLAAFLSVGMLLTACSQDALVPEPETPVEKDTDFYLNVQISTPAEDVTRAGESNTGSDSYVNGLEDEQKIHKILFVFYNSEYQYVGRATYDPATYKPIKNDQGQTYDKDNSWELQNPTTSGSVESLLKITVAVNVAAGSTKPAYVMAYVNPTLRADDDLYNDHFTAIGAMRELKDVIPYKDPSNDSSKDHPGYAMNNSVYYIGQDGNELPQIAVPVDNSLFTDPNDVTTKDPVKIYVERIVAKVTLKNTNDGELKQEKNTATDKNDKSYTLKFNVKGWGLNNLEKYTFLIKNFRDEEASNNANYSGNGTLFNFTNFKYSDISRRLSSLNTPNWNFYEPSSSTTGGNWGISGHRSFWALSPTYFNNDEVKIPSYADQIYKPESVTETLEMPNPSLLYKSFNSFYDISNLDNPKLGASGATVGNTLYTLEHTMQSSMVRDHQKRAVTCAVVVGQYELYQDGSDTPLNFDNFYIRKALNTGDGTFTNVIYPSKEAMKLAFLDVNSTLYVKPDPEKEEYTLVTGGENNADSPNPYLADFEIYHPRKDISVNNIPSRYVTLKLAPAAGSANKYYYQDSTGAFKEVTTDADKKEVNKTLYENLTGQLGGIEEYNNGYAYFEVAIRHLWGRSNSGMGDEGEFNPILGQYGIVRNHSYVISVDKIEGIGTGISDPDAPIIPNVENDTYMVKADIRVQRWRVVPVQNVTLKP